MGSVGVTGSSASNLLAEQADLVLAVGSRLQDFTTGSWALFKADNVRIIGLNTQVFDAYKHRAMPLIADKRVVPLAVTTSERARRLPEIMAVQEAGFDDRDYVGWYGFLAPKGTPRAIVEKLNKAINQALADPTIAERYRELGAEPVADRTPDEFGAFIAAERDKFGAIVRTAGIKIE